MKIARMNISHFRFILFNLKNCGEIDISITAVVLNFHNNVQ